MFRSLIFWRDFREYLQAPLLKARYYSPLFMAGGEAEDLDHIGTIRQRMLEIMEARHFHNMEAVLIVLEEVWRLRAVGTPGPGQRRVDWKDVLAQRKWMLSIV